MRDRPGGGYADLVEPPPTSTGAVPVDRIVDEVKVLDGWRQEDRPLDRFVPQVQTIDPPNTRR